MQIEVKGRNTPVTDELREHVERRFTKVGKQVSEFARLEIEVYEERNPAIADNQVARTIARATLGTRSTCARRSSPARSSAIARSAGGGARSGPNPSAPRPSPRGSARGRP
jgi:putative sigma-54 modulation protein